MAEYQRLCSSEEILETIRTKKAFICDMDGVIYHGNKLIPGVEEFVGWLQKQDKRYLFLTNSSERSPMELRLKLRRLGLQVDADHFYTSALATAGFLSSQVPHGTAYVIGEAGLINALYDVGYTMNDVNPDYVVVGESRTYTYETVVRAANLVRNGARLIGTNPDMTGPAENMIVPATGSLILPIARTAGVEPYFVGKPNPVIMRQALKWLGCTREDTVIIGDRMDTDIVSGIESSIDTVLVLTGVSDEQTPKRFAYRPRLVLDSVRTLVPADSRR